MRIEIDDYTHIYNFKLPFFGDGSLVTHNGMTYMSGFAETDIPGHHKMGMFHIDNTPDSPNFEDSLDPDPILEGPYYLTNIFRVGEGFQNKYFSAVHHEDLWNDQGVRYAEIYPKTGAYGRGFWGEVRRKQIDIGSQYLEHWQSEDTVFRGPVDVVDHQQPGGLQGCVTLGTIIKDGFLYVFYTRFIDSRHIQYDPSLPNGYPPFLNIAGETWQWDYQIPRFLHPNLCVARCVIEDFDLTTPVMKFYNGDFTQEGIGGLDTSLCDRPCHFGTIDKYGDTYVYICHDMQWNFQIFTSKDLLNWTFVQNTGIQGFYPKIYRNHLYYSNWVEKSFGKNEKKLRMMRRRIKIIS